MPTVAEDVAFGPLNLGLTPRGGARARARRRCARWAWRTSRSARRTRCRWASAGAWRSRPSWPCTPSCSCSTSRRPTSTRARAASSLARPRGARRHDAAGHPRPAAGRAALRPRGRPRRRPRRGRRALPALLADDALLGAPTASSCPPASISPSSPARRRPGGGRMTLAPGTPTAGAPDLAAAVAAPARPRAARLGRPPPAPGGALRRRPARERRRAGGRPERPPAELRPRVDLPQPRDARGDRPRAPRPPRPWPRARMPPPGARRRSSSSAAAATRSASWTSTRPSRCTTRSWSITGHAARFSHFPLVGLCEACRQA